MPTPDISQLTKRYYTIGEVADMFDVSKSLIRYWEVEFDFLKPYKNSKGDRRFTIQNIEQFAQIYQLVKERGFTLEGARRALKDQAQPVKVSTTQEDVSGLAQKLTEIRNGLRLLLDRF